MLYFFGKLTKYLRTCHRKLLKTIKHIHGRRLFHGALKERCAYVLISGRIKIILVSRLRTWVDLKKKGRNGYYEDPIVVESTKKKDLKDFRDMLKDAVLQLWGYLGG